MTAETFFAKFDQLADTPGAIGDLRALILTLASVGKLAPQNPNDEPASKLLAKIEKALEHSRAKKQLPIEPVALESLPALPDSWEWVRLGNVVEYGSPDKVDSSAIKPDDWLLDLEDIEKDTSRLLKRKSFRDGPSSSTKTTFLIGDVLYGKLRPYLNKVLVADANGYCTTEIIPIRAHGFIDPQYLCYSLKRPDFIAYAVSMCYGMNLPRLGTDDARRAPFPLPPLAEQKRIVAKVNELMALCDRLEEQQKDRDAKHAVLARAAIARFAQDPTPANLEYLFHNAYTIDPANLGKSILAMAVRGKLVPRDNADEPAEIAYKRHQALKEIRIAAKEMRRGRDNSGVEGESLHDLPETWRWCRLGEIGNASDSAIVDGPFGQAINVQTDYVASGVPVIRMVNVKPFRFVGKDLKFIRPEKFAELRRHNVISGDVLLGKVGSIGLCSTYPSSMPEGMLSTTGLCRFRVGELVDPSFLCIFLNSITDYLRSIASEAVQPFLNMKTINAIPIPLAPLDEQRRIVAKVHALMALVDRLEAELAESRALAGRLMEAVVAQLTTQG